MIVQIQDASDVRLEPYRFVRERDVAGRGERFIAEGKVVLSCLAASQDFQAESLLILEGRLNGLAALLAEFPDAVPVYVAGQKVMDEIAGFHVHRGILASGIRTRRSTLPELVSTMPDDALVVVLSNISNHDNAGGIFRNAAAFGANAVILDEQCCNPLYRKALRVSVGGVLRVPWVMDGSAEAIAAQLAGAGFILCALSPSGAEDIRTIPVSGKRAIFLGSEGDGLSPSILRSLKTYRIPIEESFDSLNVATASGIAMMLANAKP
jgi:tRNA G18 (ribose-2'-O)-methylase SpoU